jgi:hypothetical protein
MIWKTHRRQDAHSQRAALIGLAICLALVLGGLFLVYTPEEELGRSRTA